MNNYIQPTWPAPKNVKAYTTTRLGGISKSPYASFNFSLFTGDNLQDVLANRKKLSQDLNLPQEPFWLKQEHTNITVQVEKNISPIPVVADAAFTVMTGPVCVVMTADCVPILVCDQKGNIVTAIHAGWRGIAKGIITNTIKTMNTDPSQLLAWLGPAIGPQAFTVTQEVYDTFTAQLPDNRSAFTKYMEQYLANIYLLAANQLKQIGVTKIYGGEYCTFTQKEFFYSYRRDGETSGRMVSLIWLES
ncbi:MAG: peptidoglycan editing factor PgeF [Coxiellaceae bacterium]|jgi:YfiH family protein|nr:peptidoglycan editing factor PgeF [Coxiellaceae bacterium]